MSFPWDWRTAGRTPKQVSHKAEEGMRGGVSSSPSPLGLWHWSDGVAHVDTLPAGQVTDPYICLLSR